MAKLGIALPSRHASMATSVCRFERISQAIHKSYVRIVRNDPVPLRLSVPAKAYQHFRKRAFTLLSYYVDQDLTQAFHWSLAMADALPKKERTSLYENPFYWGLLAMAKAAAVSDAAVPFMSPNKLRELSRHLQLAHQGRIRPDDLETFLKESRKQKRGQAMAKHMERMAA